MDLYDASELRQFAFDIFLTSGSNPDESKLIADHLVDSNLVGHDSHGVVRIRKYIDWAKRGMVLPNRHSEVVVDRGASLLIDGNFGYGQVIGKEAMTSAYERAKQNGFSLVAIRNSGHLGRIGAWAELLADEGLASFHFVNTSGFGILVAPHGGSDRRFSANPLAAGAPVPNGAPIILDIATSVIAEGKIYLAKNKRERLDPGQILDGTGKPTTDPEKFYAEPPGSIFPFGGHKGSGLSLFCEILAGSLTGGFSSHPSTPTAGRLVNNMLSLIFDPAAFGGNDFFRADITRLVQWAKESPPLVHGGKVLMPGEIELATKKQREAAGIPIDNESWSQILETAQSLGVVPSATIRRH